MRRALVLGIALLWGPGALVGQDVEPASAFLDSSPIGAQIVLDGAVTTLKTPVVLRGLKAGPHQVSVWRSGFIQTTQTFTVEAGKVPAVRLVLSPESVTLAFPESQDIATSSGGMNTTGRQFRFPAGSYYLSGSGGTARLAPIFEDLGLLDTAGWAASLASIGTLASAARDLWEIRHGSADHPSLLTAALGTAAVSELVWYLTLQNRKSRFYRESAPEITPAPLRLNQAFALDAEGQAQLEAGDLTAAEASFRQIARDFSDSTFVPAAWFRLAKIHSVTGRQDLALGEYRLVAELYPQPAFHDRARQALADLYEAAGRPDLALYHLDRLVLADGFFDAATVQQQRERLLAAKVEEPADAGTDSPTPRQAYDRVVGLFGLGHAFTADEIARFADLKDQLAERGDGSLGDDLDLIRVASAASDLVPTDRAEWERATMVQSQRDSWVGLRNASVAVFHFSAAASVFAAAMFDRTSEPMAGWSAAGSSATMALTLFPLLWAEPRQ